VTSIIYTNDAFVPNIQPVALQNSSISNYSASKSTIDHLRRSRGHDRARVSHGGHLKLRGAGQYGDHIARAAAVVRGTSP